MYCTVLHCSLCSHKSYLDTQYVLASLHIQIGKLGRAEELLLACLAGRVAQCGANHIDTLRTKVLLAHTYSNRGLSMEAEALLSNCIDAGKWMHSSSSSKHKMSALVVMIMTDI
jgi:hypothetical protein